jgi:hypothetical protein
LEPTTDHPFYPRAFDGWALTASIFLDKVHPGFITNTLCASDLTRQARFAALAETDMNAPKSMAERLHRATDNQDLPSGCNPLAEIARSLLVLRPRAILEAVYGSCPDGLLGLLRRVDALPMDRDLYRAAFTIFDDPANRSRAEIIAQIPGPISGTKLSLISRLDPALVHKSLADRLYNDRLQIEGLHAFLTLIRTLCDATDKEITRSLDHLGPHAKLKSWTIQWLRRQTRLPIQPPIPPEDHRFQILFGEALYQHSLEFKNCLKDRLAYPALGRVLYYRWHGDRPAVLELGALSENRWFLSDLRGPRNVTVDAEVQTAIRAALKDHGVLCRANLMMPRAAAAGLHHLLDIWGFQWGGEIDDDDEVDGILLAGQAVTADQEVA